MTSIEISTSAKTAFKSGADRSAFLQSLNPSDRNFGALQFDRLQKLSEINPPTTDEIEAETKKIADVTAFCRLARETSIPYDAEAFISRVLSGRLLSAGEQRLVDQLRSAAIPTDEDTANARRQAIENLSVEREFLASRLGESAEAEADEQVIA